MLCPLCKEEIADSAIKCKHCKSMLSGQAPLDNPVAQPAAPLPSGVQSVDVVNKAKEISSSVLGGISSFDKATRKTLSAGLFKLAEALKDKNAVQEDTKHVLK